MTIRTARSHSAFRLANARFLATAWLTLALIGCGAPRPLEAASTSSQRVRTPTSSLHYRGFADADALATYITYSPAASPLVSAHRGAPTPGLAENSLEAFEHALNFAPAFIELDVRRTNDGVLVLMHDETLDRTTSGSGRVDAASFQSVRQLQLVDILGTPTAFRVPTLAEALAWADGRAVLMVDVKPDVPFEELIAHIRRADAANRVVVIVYSLNDLVEVRRLAPEIAVSVSAGNVDEVAAILEAASPRGLIAFAGVGSAEPGVIDAFHAAGIRVQVGTFPLDDAARSDPAIYDRLLDAGVDVLATDNIPGATLAVQREALDRRRASRRTRTVGQ